MEVNIKFDPSSGSQNQTVKVSGNCNPGIDETVQFQVQTVDGSKTEIINVTQEGKREVLMVSDGQGGHTEFMPSDGGTFNVVKGEWKENPDCEQTGGGEPINTYFVDSDPNPALTQDGSTDKSWIVGRRCLAKKTDSGVAICYLDENNSELFHDGTTPASLDGTMGQWMTDLPEYYFHVDESVEGTHKFQILPEEKADWKKSRRVLLGVTKAVNQDGKLWSLKGLNPTGRITFLESCDYSTVLGNGFHIVDYETHCKIAHLFVSKYANKNPQGMEQFGSGSSSYSRTTGSTSILGNNDGKTDTQISFLGVEDFYGGKDEWMGGIHGYCSTYYIYDGYETSEVPTVPYREIEVGSTNIVGYISKVYWGENGDIIPTEAKGSSSSYYFDNCYVGRCPRRSVMRSGSSSGAYCGIFSFTANQLSSYSDASVGTRIQYRGNIEVIDDPATFIAMPVGF